MELTPFASWLNTAFAAFDQGILEKIHSFAENAGGAITPLMNLFSVTSKSGVCLLILAVALMLFRKTRKMGVCMFGAICCGAIITNIILKNRIARPRPFETLPQAMEWLKFVGAKLADGASFPSGHATAAMACMTALFLNSKKKNVAWLVFLYPLGVAFSRCYLMAHYPTDVLAGMAVGLISALIAYPIANGIFKLLEKNEKNPFAHFVLYFDLLGASGKHAAR